MIRVMLHVAGRGSTMRDEHKKTAQRTRGTSVLTIGDTAFAEYTREHGITTKHQPTHFQQQTFVKLIH
jgi:hypothetical protein